MLETFDMRDCVCTEKSDVFLYINIYIALISCVVLLRDCSICFGTVMHYYSVDYNFCSISIRFLLFSPQLPL